MSRRHFFGVCVLVCAAVPLVTPHRADAGGTTQPAPVIYRLDEASTFQEGCFPPCRCPISDQIPARGTFKLTPAGNDGIFELFSVDDVNWLVPFGEPELRITGSGTYRVGKTDAAAEPMQRLVLDLTVGDDEPARFDSGLVPATDDGSISVVISMNRMFCWDRVVVVEATPVPPEEVERYRLMRGSTYQHGCWEPCDCPLGPELNLKGSFDLVPLRANSFLSEYAVVSFRGRVPGSPAAEPVRLTGFGIYLIQAEFAVQTRLSLDLFVDDEPLTHFDSGLVVGGGVFPDIDNVVSINGMYCLDTVLHVVASPR